MNRILTAAAFADNAHRGQFRKYTNRPYIEHPLRVAGRMMVHPRSSEDSVISALLHDVVEDCGITVEQVADHFGATVAEYVKWLTNPSHGWVGMPRGKRKKIDRDHLRDAPPVCKVIKMLDRTDNLQDMSLAPADFLALYCSESRLLLDAIKDADSDLSLELHGVILEREAALRGVESADAKSG